MIFLCLLLLVYYYQVNVCGGFVIIILENLLSQGMKILYKGVEDTGQRSLTFTIQ